MGRQVKKPTSKPKKEVAKNPLFESNPRNFQIGNSIRPKRDLTRVVKWPKYILLQRQKKILLNRLKVPAPLATFRKAVDSNQSKNLFRILDKYQPENKTAKKSRLQALAASKEKGKEPNAGPKPITLKYGLNHVTYLVENNKAKLVAIAADVTPIELIVWLPQLCKKKGVTYCIVKSKARLGKLVGKKSASCVALKDVRKEDVAGFEELSRSLRAEFNDSTTRRYLNTFRLGMKSQHKLDALNKAKENEIVSKN